ncbi:hypothetical protein IKT64_02850 [Candidatus Saccharibacteria bacterium]|nr:hypothetical protein [Candidatus Saccharibacteria bacterium]
MYKIKTIAIFIAFVIAPMVFLVVIFNFANALFDATYSLISNTFPQILDCSIINKATYSWIILVTWVLLSILLGEHIYSFLNPETIQRDKNFILELFKNRGYGSPISTRIRLIEKIYGKSEIDEKVKQSLDELIDKNINPIKEFLEESGDKHVLCINGKWGSGKTTSLLIAINETENNNKYIYESAFKYSGSENEFIKDLLSTLNDTTLKMGMKNRDDIDSLIKNLDSSPQKTIGNFMRNHKETNLPSSELIYKLNRQYENLKTEELIYIIIDDIDRLQGKEIIDILAVLSILKNLVFVRVIIPADLDVVCKALDTYRVVESQRFIEKYLPSQMSIKLSSNYDMVEKILLDKIDHTGGTWEKASPNEARPALAAIFIGILAKRLEDETRNYKSENKSVRYAWLSNAPNPQRLPDNINEPLFQLLQTPLIIRAKESFRDKYVWNTNYNNITRFKDVIYAIKKRLGERGRSATYISINEHFSDEEYSDVIDSWIFDYMEKRWDIFGFTIRDALDMWESIRQKEELPKDRAEQFVYIFNQLFPDRQIKTIK